jgi:Tol biopolymer transport system component
MATRARRTLNVAGTGPHYVQPGFLVYAQAGSLMAVPFDTKRLEVTGTPVQVVDGVLQSVVNGFAHYDVSADGLLVYLSGGMQTSERKLIWVDRTNGSERVVPLPTRAYRYPRISPDDGSRIAVTVEGTSSHVWVYNTRTEVFNQLTFEGGVNLIGAWTPDGTRVAFSSTRGGVQNPYWQTANGSGAAERLLTSENVTSPASFSRDGQFVASTVLRADTGYDIDVLHLSDRKTERLLQTRATEGAPTFSPNGHWLAYMSQEQIGPPEIFVQPFPATDIKWKVSTEGGTEPVWRHDGKELFYRSGNQMMAVPVSTEGTFSYGKPHALFEAAEYVPTSGTFPNYDVSSDGQRFLMVKSNDQAQVMTQINVVTNWGEELKRRVPAK